MSKTLTKKSVLLGTIVFAVLLGALTWPLLTSTRERRSSGRPVRPVAAEPQAEAQTNADNHSSEFAPEHLSPSDWPQFRGPKANGTSDDKKIPLEWGDSRNIAWKMNLPGPGSSSPVVVGDRVFVTCYSGYGVDPKEPGKVENLKRHLLCIKSDTGDLLWSHEIDATLPEDAFSGMGITEHGYASSTPVTDGERVYAFFGKSGVFAFDLEGTEIWRADVGHETSNRAWGSSASPILYRDLVIVNASEESCSIRAIEKTTGHERWKAEGTALELTYATPVITDVDKWRQDLVLGVPGEVWGLDPNSGKLTWHAKTTLEGNIAPSPTVADGIVYIMGGYPKQQTIAVRPGGNGDVAPTHVVWSNQAGSYIASPVYRDGHLYWTDDKGFANCVETSTGNSVYHERLPREQGARSGKPDYYASDVLIADRLYVVSRTSGTFVLPATPDFSVLAHNQITADKSDFNASPAISKGRMFLRSNHYLYCIEEQS